jgi:RHS repeat-associated protein
MMKLKFTEVEWIVTTGTLGEQMIEVEPAFVPKSYTRELGHKQYELSNHLGIVLVVINDIKRAVINNNSIEYYTAQVVSATDYSPFGVSLAGRTFSSEGYRYGFNGKEKDAENFEGAYDFGARIMDTRLGRWLSVDMMYQKQPQWSVYKAFKDSPIIFADPDGNSEFLTIIIKDQHGHSIKKTVLKSEDVMTDFKVQVDKITLFGEPWIETHSLNYYDFETTITYTIDDNGKLLSTETQTKILYENGVKDNDLKLTIGNDTTKDPDGFNNIDFQETGLHLTSEDGGSDPIQQKNNGGRSVDIGDFLTAVSGFMKDPASMPKILSDLGPAEYGGLITELKGEVDKVKNNQKGNGSNSQSQGTTNGQGNVGSSDSLYIEYQHNYQSKTGSKNWCQTYKGTKGVPADTVGGVLKGNPNDVIKSAKPLNK